MEIPKEITEAQERLLQQRMKIVKPAMQPTVSVNGPGLPSTERPLKAACPLCLTPLETLEAAREHMQRCREERAAMALDYETRLLSMGILREHAGAQLSDFAESELARLWLQEPRGLLITGPVGSGKTRFLAALCREFLEAKKSVQYTMARSLFRRLTDTFNDGRDEAESEVIEELCEADFLAIDDLAHEGRATEWVIGSLHEIISRRHGNFKATAITTNLSGDEIGRHYDASIASRLNSWLAIPITGKGSQILAGTQGYAVDVGGIGQARGERNGIRGGEMNELEYFAKILDMTYDAMHKPHDEDCDCQKCIDEAREQQIEDMAEMQRAIGGVK